MNKNTWQNQLIHQSLHRRNGKIALMNFNAELARFATDSTLPDWVKEAVKDIVNEAQKSVRSNLELTAAQTPK